MDRNHARAIIQEISAYNVYTHYRVQGGRLYVSSPTGLLPEQRALAILHRDSLIAFCTTPPIIEAECVRGHSINWRFNPVGCWLCSCFFLPYASQTKEETTTQPAASSKSFVNYWLTEVAR